MGGADRPEPASVLTVRVRVTGRVQGVFFRHSTARAAADAGVSGWVRNLSDGSVEAVFQGSRAALDRMVEWCRTGPPAARVDAVDIDPIDVPGITGFSVR